MIFRINKKINPELQKKRVKRAFKKLHDPAIVTMSDTEFQKLTTEYKKELDIYNHIENKLILGVDY